MNGELERLLVKIEADTQLLRREMAAGDKSVQGFAANTERNLSRSKSHFSTFEKSATGALSKFGAALAAAGLASKAFAAVSASGEINDLSRNASLSTDTFQAYAYAANKAGMETEAFGKAAQKFAVNVAQARAETGSFNSFLDAQLPKLGEQIRATKTQEEAFRLIANAIVNLKTEEDKTTLAIEAFGRAGADMVEILAKGAGGLDAAAEAAKKLGLIQSGETLASTEKLKEEYAELSGVIDSMWVKGVAGAYSFIKAIGAALNDPNLKNIRGGRFFQGQGQNSVPAGASVPSVPGNPTRNFGGGLLPPSALAGGETALQPTAAKAGEWVTEINTRGADALSALNAKLAASTADAFDDIKASYDADLKEFETLLASKEIDESEFQEAKSKLQQIAAEKTAEAIKTETQTQRAYFSEIEGLISNQFMGAFSNALETGKFKAEEFFAGLLKGFAELTVQALVLKPLLDSIFGAGGGGASLFSSLGFGGPRAAGGPVLGGRAHLVGERGPELFVPSSSGNILNAGATSRAGGGNAQVYNIDARGADIGVAERIERALAMAQKGQKDPVSTLSKQQRRYPTRGL